MEKDIFNKKEIIRARRDIQGCMEDILNNFGRTMYHVNIKRFINLIEFNRVLKFLTAPFYDLDTNNIEEDDDGWIELNISDSIDYQIAYVFKKFKYFSSVDDQLVEYNFLYDVFRNTSSYENVEIWNNEVVKPCFREILFRIDDLIEDLPKEEEVNAKYMSIINIGSISNANGNLAIGDKNIQNNNSVDLFEDIIRLINENINDDYEKEEALRIANELKDNQNKGSFKDIVPKFIAATAKYGPIFLGMWQTLQNICD
ncbi:hypothetical protein A500_17325 [Clostridium sartagoforme AAU1]|uniref:Uncharacterized protein n=1 Tax=Clostridium sartagoforme AAU1 TaxID=1202534 RepID=R9BTM8_9CLOT|nr:hypothetical protein [Clostridium sartagoforme]EOR20418.1 hypothetical protein A500_17325 [Clostridium sartagoforme AAU1]